VCDGGSKISLTYKPLIPKLQQDPKSLKITTIRMLDFKIDLICALGD
jgi:hypothetical protein